MNFLSDTTAPAHPAILDALGRANEGFAPSYGADPVSARVKAQLCELFETDLDVVFTTSGTASNALALSVLCPPDAMVLCHDEAHIHRDERGAPEFFTKGGKLLPLHGDHAKISPDSLADALKQWPNDFVHATPPAVLSLSQLNESGCAYSLDELDALIRPAKAHELHIHMDGARFSNALATLGCSPAEMTWKAGVDILSLGATKNGAMASEAVLLFPDMQDRLPRLLANQKRAGLMLPKMRYVSAQMGAWLEDELWLDLARKANAAAKRLSDGLAALEGAELVHPTHGNEVFIRLEDSLAARLRDAGAGFYSWPDGSARFVASWCTTEADISAVLEAAR
ncbi:low specificity L-threonine aldolase [Oceanicaulis sp. MMSF_3324]|uniref:threonine aldolase family protein n=1 Tax=Oceanicaulis sp. MMSF_3324 TaxID=3046702 RepID=UPI00273D43B3|nr:beta-eliminating lyase-related protein [Oceanicaulis sp. MMSF_3324]